MLADEPEPRLRLPSSVREGRYEVSGRAVRGVVFVVVLALVVLGGRYLLAERAAQPSAAGQVSSTAPAAGTVETAGDRSGFGGAVSPSGSAPSGTASSGAAEPTGEVTVHVVGQVKAPGLVTIAAGSRVGDAVDEASGVTDEADLTGLNLARVLVDGEQIHVPKEGETAPSAPAPGSSAEGSPASPGASPGGPGAGGLVNLNTADVATLETLPGVGPVLAQRIVEWREANGGFTAVDELGEVSGIGEKTFADLAPRVTV